MIKINMISLGCPKNQVDSEFMEGVLSEEVRFDLVEKADQADVIIINTCGFIEDAKQESIDTILNAGRLKEEGACEALIVTGCLTQRYKEEISDLIPEIDGMLGAGNYNQIAEIIENVLEDRKVNLVDQPNFDFDSSMPRRLNDSHYAYVKIAEGCNNRCSYCVIPDIRGPVTSRPIDDICQEIRNLVNNGVQEIILVAQDITQYGIDLYGEAALEKLLKQIIKLDKLPWIRLLYSYPERINDSLIQIIKENEEICNYLDLPIQHSSGRIRKLMSRQGSKEDIVNLIEKLRTEIPDIVLRTSLIVGFPGETESDFENLLNFVEQIKFDRLGVFKYSKEEGTPAAEMEAQVPENVKEERYNRIMSSQKEISRLRNEELVGEVLPVLIDEVQEDYVIGRTQYDAPEIDNQIIIHDSSAKIGEIICCQIKDAYEYDLIGEII
ncbi:MAG: 30S ribosomal protein S12 methylthiotransferase RimO [bacterium]